MRRLLPGVLRSEPQFALLFYSQALSTIGDRITLVALPFAVLSIGGSTADVGLVIAASTIPFAVFTLAGGVWADRLPRQLVMLASDLVRLVAQGLAATLLLLDAVEVWQLAAIYAVYGTADAFFSPAATGLVPLVVSDPARYQEANALRALMMSSGMVAGPAVAGVLIAVMGPGGALAVDALTFAVSAAFLARLKPARQVEPREPRAAGSFLREFKEGFAEVRSRQWVWASLIACSVYHLVVLPAVFVLGPVLFDEELGGARDWAIVTACFGAGSILGDVIAMRFKPGRPMLIAACGLVVASTQALIIGSGLSVAAIAALEALTGVGVSLFFTLWETSLQEQIPETSISRVSSFDYLVTTGLLPVGVLLAGPFASGVGLHTALHTMTFIAVPVMIALVMLPSVRHLRRPAAVHGTT